MNASLLTADRTTHLKIRLVACMCILGAIAFAAPASADAGFVVVSLRSNWM